PLAAARFHTRLARCARPDAAAARQPARSHPRSRASFPIRPRNVPYGPHPHERDVAVRPRRVLDRDEIAPEGAILEQAMALQLVLEQRLAERDRVVLAGMVEPSLAPRRFRRLDDERGMAFLVLIRVHPPQAVF